MTETTIDDIAAALRRLGVQPGDTVMYHGSMKSLGHMNGGAPAVIDGVLLEMNGQRYDNTLRHRLETIRQALTAET